MITKDQLEYLVWIERATFPDDIYNFAIEYFCKSLEYASDEYLSSSFHARWISQLYAKHGLLGLWQELIKDHATKDFIVAFVNQDHFIKTWSEKEKP